MATADTEEYLSERECGHILFSKQYCGQLIAKVVKLEGVVQKFIDSRTISEDERKSLRNKKVADQKFRHLLTIITDHSNRNELQAFKTFIDILRETNNIDIAQQLSPIYNERINYAEIRNEFLKAKSSIANLENKISELQRILKEKEGSIESLTHEKNKLVKNHRKVADAQRENFREEQLSLEKQIKEKEDDLLFAKQEIEKLTRTKNVLENEVKVKSNDIRKREEEIVEKERKVREAIEESDRLRLKIDTLKQQYRETMLEDKEMSKKIEKLEDEITEKENTIMNLRKNKTMTREEIEEELGNITKGQEKKLDDQTEMIKEQNKKIDDQAAMAKQQNDKIDFLTDAVMRALSLQENK